MKVTGQWHYIYRAIDQFGQVIDVHVSSWRDTKAAQRFFERAVGTTRIAPTEVTTDQASVSPAVLEDLLPAAWHPVRHTTCHQGCWSVRVSLASGPSTSSTRR